MALDRPMHRGLPCWLYALIFAITGGNSLKTDICINRLYYGHKYSHDYI